MVGKKVKKPEYHQRGTTRTQQRGMSGVRFYQEFRDKAKRRSAGTIVAALVCNGLYWTSGKICYEAIAG